MHRRVGWFAWMVVATACSQTPAQGVLQQGNTGTGTAKDAATPISTGQAGAPASPARPDSAVVAHAYDAGVGRAVLDAAAGDAGSTHAAPSLLPQALTIETCAIAA